MKNVLKILIVFFALISFQLAEGQVIQTQSFSTENIDLEYSERKSEFINHQYLHDEFLPHTLVFDYKKKQIEWYEPFTDWLGGAPVYKVTFYKVVLNDIEMAVFFVPEENYTEANYGQLCWVLPIYNTKVIYQINTSYIANDEILKMQYKYKLSAIKDDKLKQWLKGIDLTENPFKNITGVELIAADGNYYIVEFNLKQE